MVKVDPVTLELIRCRLESAAQQMAASLWKSSYSTVIREVLDYSTALFDKSGNMVAQSAQLPFQMMTMSSPLKFLHDKSYDWSPRDVVLLNDPYVCDGQHLPDFMVFRPIYFGPDLVGFAGAIAHMIDVGGGAPGSYVATATEVFQEGLRLPPIKIVSRGKINTEILDLIRLNVREPDKLMGDLSAMIASTSLGEGVLIELVEKYGLEMLISGMDKLLQDSEKLLRLRVGRLPDGDCSAVDYVDDDGISDDPICIRAKISIQNDQIEVDFTGSSQQALGPVNATFAMTEATVTYVLMAVLGDGVIKNDGCRRVAKILAPSQSIVNAKSPAPVASRVTTCHRIVDVLLQAFAQFLPGRVMAGYYGVSNICNLGGQDSETGGSWVHFEIEVGGWGARPTSDGLDGFSAHIHNLCNTPVEVVEAGRPLRVERYEFIPDSGGVGKYRGGMGLRRDIKVLEDKISLNLLGDRCKFPPKGLLGGGNGQTGSYILNPDTEEAIVMDNKVSNFPMKVGDVISMRTPGGGGFGEPVERDPDLHDLDIKEGKVTKQTIGKTYA